MVNLNRKLEVKFNNYEFKKNHLRRGLGRLVTNRKKLIAIIAQSFVTASQNQVFVNKLTIFIHPDDIEKSNLNLFEVKDFLNHYLP
ncbi:hypothetical protein EB354_03095 [Chryseobacterium balustinum]|nr:hypothetical protein EB354_03095 [Chryseobacterium balustinum]